MPELATFAGGCFWCTEAIFQRLRGVLKVTSGYTGGKVENPSYERVSLGFTGHAEAVQLEFEPDQIPYKVLLDVFWNSHDPTTLNQQGYDVGTQYRSVIFYHTPTQHRLATASKVELEKNRAFVAPIVTEILPFTTFYTAEEYHQNYYNQNQSAGYCKLVISPKVKHLLSQYPKLIKEEYR